MRQSRLIGIAGVFLAAALSVPAWGTDPAQPKPHAARPGGLNYLEGQVSIDGEALGAGAIGYTELSPGQSLETGAGKAELLLTPGVFFRLGDNSSAVLISPSLTDTELRLDKGEATVEVAELHPENNIVIAEDGAKVRLAKTGLYEFDADHNVVRVYQGQADVEVNGQNIEVKSEHVLALNAGGPIKPEKFDKEAQDDLYRWSSLRSSYLAEANVDRAQVYQMGNWYGAGWDWDPYYGAYTFIPGDGIFYSPFGWGFFSPFDVGFAPFVFFGHFHHDITILTTFVTFAMGTTLPTGDTLAIGAGLVMQGTLPGSIMKVTTTTMSTMASTVDPGIPFTADSPAVHKWPTGDSMEAKDSTAPVERDSMGAEEDFTVVAAEGFMVAAVVEAITEAWNIAKPKSGSNGNRDADASRFFCAICVVTNEKRKA